MKTRINDWLDPKTGAVLYGVQVFCRGEWMNAAANGKPCLFDTAKERDALRKELQRTKEPTS